MNNNYKVQGSHVVIYLQDSKGNVTGEAFIDLLEIDRVIEFPNTWRLQKVRDRLEIRGTYRVNGLKKQTTLAKWILDFPKKPIYFLDGNTLNHRMDNLSFNKPLKGNKIIANEDMSLLHISRRNEDDLVVIIDTEKIDLVSRYTWVCDKKSDINDYVVYTKIYEENASRKISLRNLLLGNEIEKTAYFVNGNRLDFRMKNIKLYAEDMTNEFYVENNIAYILVKVKNEEQYVVTMIDEEDLEKVRSLGYTWHYFQSKGDPYVVNTIVEKDGSRKRVYLHRVVNNCPDELVVDHINHNTLDNRKCNLSNVTASLNQQNRKGANKNSRSGIRNVNWDNTHKDWIVTCGQSYIMRTKDFNEAILAAIQVRSEMFPFAAK